MLLRSFLNPDFLGLLFSCLACATSTNWDAWKVFVDPAFNGREDVIANTTYPVIEYVKNDVASSITSSTTDRITFDPMGFANINTVATTRSGWTWASTFANSEWSWTYTFSGTAYTGTYSRTFTIKPSGCTGTNGRQLEINQNGTLVITSVSCP